MGKSFIGSLGKGFIRSAVNQVGRDMGRVVSNNAFGDAHSIPHRSVNNNYYNYNNIPNYLKTISTNSNVTESQIFVDTPTDKNYILWILLSITSCGIGFIVWFISGLYIYYKKTISCYKFRNIVTNNVVAISDRRYSIGYRTENVVNQQLQKIKFELPIQEATIEQITAEKNYAKSYIFFSGIVIIGSLFILFYFESFIKA